MDNKSKIQWIKTQNISYLSFNSISTIKTNFSALLARPAFEDANLFGYKKAIKKAKKSIKIIFFQKHVTFSSIHHVSSSPINLLFKIKGNSAFCTHSLIIDTLVCCHLHHLKEGTRGRLYGFERGCNISAMVYMFFFFISQEWK